MFLMLIRALHLSSVIEVWTFQERNAIDLEDVLLNDAAWDHVRYLIVLLRPYFVWTEVTSRTTAVLVNKAWTAYTSVFQHLEQAEAKLLRKTTLWKYNLADSVVAARQKLAAYFSKTYGPGGEVYNWATILDPMLKLESYKSSFFNDDDRKAFESSFRTEYTESYSDIQQAEPLSRDSDQLSHNVDFAKLVTTAQPQESTKFVTT